MSGFLSALLAKPRITLTVAIMLALNGVFAWLTMPRLEDPEMADRWGIVLLPYPGAAPEVVERTVVRAVEQELAQVAELQKIDTDARLGVAVITLEMADALAAGDIEESWDRVEEALTRAQADFPNGAGKPVLDRNVSDPESIVLAVTGADALTLAEAADRIESDLLGLSQVSRITRLGDPGEQVTIELDETVSHHLGITRSQLTGLLAARHVTVPAGFVNLDGRTATLRPEAEFHSVEEIQATPIPLSSGSAVALGDIARVTRGPLDPPQDRMRFNGRVAVGLGVVPQRPVDLVKFGESVRAKLSELRPQLAPVEVHEVAFQPAHVEHRLQKLGISLVQSIAIVGGLLIFFMGHRMGLLVAAIVPLVTLSSLGVYAAAGGVLHQMSIAALVIAIGMLVDNAIVIAEDVQTRIDAGSSRLAAGRDAAMSLAVPLGTATGTTLAAFVPMLMTPGPLGEFTSALPRVIMLTLFLSYLFALFVTPTLARWLRPTSAQAGSPRFEQLATKLSELAVSRSRWVLAAAAIGVLGSVYAARFVEASFFPHGDRNQMIVDLSLPQGSDLDRIDELAEKLEHALSRRPEIDTVATFVGRGAPHFYYNVWTFPKSPHRAQLLITTDVPESVERVQAFVRSFARRELPEVSVAAQKLEQGPGIAAPIEIRIYSPDLDHMENAVEAVVRTVSTAEGTTDVRETMGTGLPSVRVSIDDATAARRGMARSDVVMALLGETHGLEVGQLRSGRDPVPVLVRAPAGRHTPPDLLSSAGISAGARADAVPLAELADTSVEWLPASIHHRNRRRMTSVLADVAATHSYGEVMKRLGPQLDGLSLPPGVELEIGGVGEGSSDANAKMMVALPLGALLLIGFLLIEFNSFRRVAIVLSTIPLAATGVIPGLLLGDQPFGFMSTLGVTALAGVVVNNAIVLLDMADARMAAGVPLEEATRHAVRARTRPIVLTSVTTMAGLLPLATSTSSLWPPLAWAMISGLAASTLLTLLVVPALYVVFMKPRRFLSTSAAAVLLCCAAPLFSQTSAFAQPATPQTAKATTTDSSVSPQDEPAAPIETFSLRDALIAESGGLTAAEVAELARARSPAIESIKSGADAALWDAKNAKAGFLPRIDLMGQYKRVNKVPVNLSGGSASTTGGPPAPPSNLDPTTAQYLLGPGGYTEWLSGLAPSGNFTQPLDQLSFVATATVPLSDYFLTVWPSYRGAVGVAESQAVQAEVVASVVDQQARSAFYAYARAVAARIVTEQAVKQAEAQTKQIRLFVDAGTAAPVDLMTATARRERARGALAAAEGQVRVARNQLAILTGLGPERLAGIGEPVMDLPKGPKQGSEELVDRALRKRPEVKALRKLLGAQDTLRKAERNRALPQLRVSGSDIYAKPNPRYFAQPNEFRNSWEVGATLSWTPNNALTGSNSANKMAANVAKTRADLATQEDTVRGEVVQAYESYKSAIEIAHASEAQLAAAEEAYRVRLAMYRVGAGVIVDLLDADLEVSQARLAHANAALDARSALALLERVAVLGD